MNAFRWISTIAAFHLCLGALTSAQAATPFVHETVDGAGPFVGQYTSLALDDSGNPHISYYEIGDDDLRYASKSGGIWALETVDGAGGVGGSEGGVELSVYDIHGRLVHRIATGSYRAGYQAVTWDGRDIRGQAVAAWVYLLRVTGGPAEARTLKFRVLH